MQSGSEARERLQAAAVELFRAKGFDRTTTAEIAARAGVTERTFFRYFPDKREVLFDGQAVLAAALTRSIAAAAPELGPVEVLFGAFRSVCDLLEGNRPFSEPRQQVIATTPALQERELAKIAALADELASVLTRRGVSPAVASLAGRVGMSVFAQVTEAWLEDPSRALIDRLNMAEAELRSLFRPEAA